MKTYMSVLLTAIMSFSMISAESTDFINGVGVVGWSVSSGEYTSPLYSNAVDSVVMKYSGTGTGTLYATGYNGVESQVAHISSLSSMAAFYFPETTDVRSFRIACEGEWKLHSFEADVAPAWLDAPGDVAVSNNVTGNSFDAFWSAVAGAEGYKVYVWTNVVAGISAGVDLWVEDFPNSPSVLANNYTTVFEDGYSDNPGWTAENVFATPYAGVLRIGSSSRYGSLKTPLLPLFSQSPLVLRFTARRYNGDSGKTMPVKIVTSAGETNDLGTVILDVDDTTYHVELPALAEGDCILFSSATNKTDGRVLLDNVAVVHGYSAGTETPVYIINGQDVGDVLNFSFTGLPSALVNFAVEAYGKRETTDGKRETYEVDLANPDQTAKLFACSIRNLENSVYEQNFDSLAPYTASTGAKEWFNGVTLPGWQAWKGDGAVESVKWNAGKANVGGLYALATEVSDERRAFGGRSTQDLQMSWGVVFTNDMDVAMALEQIVCSVQQWGFANTQTQYVEMCYAVSDRIDWMNASGLEWVKCAETALGVWAEGEEHETPVSSEVSLVPAPALKLEPGKVLYLKWILPMPESGQSAMAAIDDFRVVFSSGDRPTVVTLVRNDAL